MGIREALEKGFEKAKPEGMEDMEGMISYEEETPDIATQEEEADVETEEEESSEESNEGEEEETEESGEEEESGKKKPKKKKNSYDNRIGQLTKEKYQLRSEFDGYRSEAEVSIREKDKIIEELKKQLEEDGYEAPKMTQAEIDAKIRAEARRLADMEKMSGKVEQHKKMDAEVTVMVMKAFADKFNKELDAFDDDTNEDIQMLASVYKADPERWRSIFKKDGVKTVLNRLKGVSPEKPKAKDALKKIKKLDVINDSSSTNISPGSSAERPKGLRAAMERAMEKIKT